mgnify:CR=1 FL=1
MRGRKKDTLCWDCTKAAAKGCAWAGRFEPVKGWKAERVQRQDLKDGETFHVINSRSSSRTDGRNSRNARTLTQSTTSA